MKIFWSLGFDAASMADLRVGLGITQASIYAAEARNNRSPGSGPLPLNGGA
jgi:hypothetical protein